MAFTTTQLAAMETAISTGTKKVRYDGKEVEYHSMTELISARNLIRAELEASGQLSATPARGMTTVLTYDRT
jgi:hypothetical protein